MRPGTGREAALGYRFAVERLAWAMSTGISPDQVETLELDGDRFAKDGRQPGLPKKKVSDSIQKLKISLTPLRG